MKLVRVQHRSDKIDQLVSQSFGPGESLWSPRYFDRLYKLVDHRKVLGVCTLQWAPDGYWILGDLCVAEQGQGHGSEIVKQICSKIREPIWADATHPGSERILKRNSFGPTRTQPWVPQGVPLMRIRTCDPM